MKNHRGSNQSVDTKFATILVDDAITFIETGRVQKGVDMLRRALDMLPDIGLERQENPVEHKGPTRGFA